MFFPIEPAYDISEDFPSEVILVESGSLQKTEKVSVANKSSYLLSQLEQETEQYLPVRYFKDVEPYDWAYEAVRNLADKYQCLSSETNAMFRGDEAISRYEFAVSLNTCLEAIYSLIESDTSISGDEALVGTLNQLTTEFDNELASISQDVAELEDTVADLESTLFSKYTKLDGEAVFALTTHFGENFVEGSEGLSFLPGVSVELDSNLVALFNEANTPVVMPPPRMNPPGNNPPMNRNRGNANQRPTSIPRVDALVDNEQVAVFGYRVRLDLDTSFTGKDSLLIRLAGTNLRPFTANSRGRFKAPAIPPFLPRPIDARFVGNTGETFQTFNINESKLIYSFPVGATRFNVAAAGAAWHDFAPTTNPFFFDYDGGQGGISTLSSQSPIYRIGGGTGLVVNAPLAWRNEPNKAIDLTLGYLAGADVSDPFSGFAKASYGVLAQTTFELGNFDWGLTYVHAYNRENDALFNHGFNNRDGFVGTQLANLPGTTLQRLTEPLVGLSPTGVVSNSYGIQGAWKVSEKVSLSGYFAYTDLKILGQGDGDLWTYGVGLALPNFGKENNLLGIFFGAQPYISNLDLPRVTYRNETTPFHLEAFYRHQVMEDISITPGVIWLMAPNGFDRDVVIASLRTTFRF